MGFGAPPVLTLLLGVVAVAGLYGLALGWKAAVVRRLTGGLGPGAVAASWSRPRQVVKGALVLLALTAVVLAAARPYLGAEPPTRRPGQGDLLVVLDVSLSMAAQDVAPSRLARAKQEVLGLIDRLQGERVGLVVFSGGAALRFPLTYDYEAARVLVRAVEADSAPLPGTALAEGVRTALRGLRQSEVPLRAILLLSDGEDQGSPYSEAAAEAAAAGIPIHVLGVGTAQGGPIPVPGPGGSGTTVKRDGAGQVVQTRLEEEALRLVAERTQGSYQRAASGGASLRRVYEGLTLQGSGQDPALPGPPANDLTPFFALAAFLLLLVDWLLPEQPQRVAPLGSVLGLASLTLLLAVGCSPRGDAAFDFNQTGVRLYRQARFFEALEAFRNAQVLRPDLPELNFNTGSALFKAGEMERALRELQRSLAAGEGDLRAKAHFNMGNAYFALERFQDAFEEYKKALRDTPSDFDAKVNLELALRRSLEQQRLQGESGGQPGGPQDPSAQQPGQQGGDRPEAAAEADPRGGPPKDPAEELRRAVREAGQELGIEEALRILDALRERERQLQVPYHQQVPGSARAPRPDKDW